jgi:hypothetical protein
VPGGVTEIERTADSGLALVLLDDACFDAAGFRDHREQS